MGLRPFAIVIPLLVLTPLALADGSGLGRANWDQLQQGSADARIQTLGCTRVLPECTWYVNVTLFSTLSDVGDLVATGGRVEYNITLTEGLGTHDLAAGSCIVTPTADCVLSWQRFVLGSPHVELKVDLRIVTEVLGLIEVTESVRELVLVDTAGR